MDDFEIISDLPDLIPITLNPVLDDQVVSLNEQEEDENQQEEEEDSLEQAGLEQEEVKQENNTTEIQKPDLDIKLKNEEILDLIVSKETRNKIYFFTQLSSVFMIYVIGKLVYKFIMW
jgi:hypothetical protein